MTKVKEPVPSLLHLDRFNTLSAKITVTTMAIVIAMAMLISTFLIGEHKRALEANIEAMQAGVVKQVAFDLQKKLQFRLNALDEAAKRVDVRRLDDPGYLERFMSERFLMQTMFSGGLLIVDATGSKIIDFPVVPGRRDRPVGDRDYLKEPVRTGRPYVGPPILGRGVARWVLNMSAPITDASGAVKAVLVGVTVLANNSFLDLADETGRLGLAEVYLISLPDEHFIVAPDPNRSMTLMPPPGSSEAADKIRSGFEGSARMRSSDGTEKLYSIVRLSKPAWALAVATPTQVAFAPAQQWVRSALWLALLSTTLAVAIMWAVVSRLMEKLTGTSRLLDVMSQTVRKLKAIPEAGEREIRTLIASFNRLIGSIQDQQVALQSSEELSRLAQEGAHVGVWEWDLQSNHIFWSAESSRLYGLEAIDREISPDDWIRLVHPDDVVQIEAQRANIGPGQPFEVEIRILPKAGGCRWILSKGSVQLDAAGKPVRLIGISQDITERKVAELALLESEQRYRSILDNAADGTFIASRAGRYTYVNRKACELLGYSCNELLALGIQDITPPEDAERSAAAFQTLLRDGTLNVELLLKRKDGSIVPVELNAILLPDGNAYGSTRDITQRKRQEAELHKAAQRLLQNDVAMEAAGIGIIWVDDASGRVLYANATHLERLGYSAGEIANLHAWSFNPTLDPEAYRQIGATLRAVGQMRFESTHRTKNGREFPVDVFILFQPEHGDLPARRIIFSTDITQRKEAEAELARYRDTLEEQVQQRTLDLRQTHQKLAETQFAMDKAGVGVTWLDAATGQFLYSNDFAHDLVGYSGPDMLAATVFDIAPELTPDSYRELVRECQKQGRLTREFLTLRKDGRRVPVEVIAYYLPGEAGTPDRLIEFITDITQRKADEKALRQAREQAESANQAKSAFLANMSHEIRTPLNGVLGLAQIGYRDNVGRSRTQETFSRILDSGNLLLAIINDILDFSKIEAGKLAIEEVPLDPDRLVNDAIQGVTILATMKSIRLTVTNQPLPANVLGDPLRISQILNNLLSNAIKFTVRGEVNISTRQDGEELVFAVRDSGIGIPPEVLARLFQPFEQADGSTTRKFGGSGLGLAISRRLAALMNGTLDAESTPGHGSTFTLRLPLKATDQLAEGGKHPVATAGRRLAGLYLLVAEDNAINQLVLNDLLQGEGAEVKVVANGQQAVEAVTMSDRPFDAVLMDVQMPVMDGLEAARLLKQVRPELPVIGQTAHALKDELDKCIAAGMVATVNKPIDIDALVSSLLGQLPEARRTLVTSVHAGIDAPAGRSDSIDWDSLMRQFPNRPEFVDRLVQLFVHRHADDGARLRSLAAAANLSGIETLAHELKGAAGNLFAPEVKELATTTVTSARQHSPASFEEARELADALDRLIETLRHGTPV